VVGVIDSGVEVDHPGLVKNLWRNVNEVPDNGKDDDGNGYVDDVYGWNFISGKNGDVGVDNTEVARVVRQYKPFLKVIMLFRIKKIKPKCLQNLICI
jgi:subtilisin family serine protease